MQVSKTAGARRRRAGYQSIPRQRDCRGPLRTPRDDAKVGWRCRFDGLAPPPGSDDLKIAPAAAHRRTHQTASLRGVRSATRQSQAGDDRGDLEIAAARGAGLAMTPGWVGAAQAAVAALRRILQTESLRGARRATRQSQVAKALNWCHCEEPAGRRGSLGLAMTVVT